MSDSLTLAQLQSAVAGRAAALRSITELQPVGGPGDKIFPATYAGGVYATEKRRLPGQPDLVECVLVNSVQSEANHAELALREAIARGEIALPLIEVDFSAANGSFRKPISNLTSLDVPHRLADAILRDANLPDGTRFSASSHAKRWSRSNLWDATAIYELCPTALVFGMWGSPEKPGGLGAKFERAYVSEIVAIDVTPVEKRSGFRIDPIQASSKVMVVPKGDGFEVAEAKAKGGLAPSKINHSNIPFDSTNAGIRCHHAEQTTVVSLGALRKLRFPVNGATTAAIDNAGRTVLAAIGICAGVLAAERGTSLRSRCHLWPTGPRVWELLETPGQAPARFSINAAQATALLNQAVAAAEAAGLTWHSQPITLTPTPELIELIRQSQEVAAKDEGSAE